jgi:hypothetical protein
LQADLGLAVFAEEEAAVDKIADLIQHSHGAVPGLTMEGDLNQIARSNEELAQITIAGAGESDSKEVRKAKAALLEGQNDLAAAFAAGAFKPDQLDAALEDFREAWEDALKARS